MRLPVVEKTMLLEPSIYVGVGFKPARVRILLLADTERYRETLNVCYRPAPQRRRSRPAIQGDNGDGRVRNPPLQQPGPDAAIDQNVPGSLCRWNRVSDVGSSS